MATQDVKDWNAREVVVTDRILVDGGTEPARVDVGSLYQQGRLASASLFEDLRDDRDTCLLYYPDAFGLSDIYTPLGRFTSPPGRVVVDGVLCYQGVHEMSISPSSKMIRDGDNLWNTSGTVIFHIEDVDALVESSTPDFDITFGGSTVNNFCPDLSDVGVTALWSYNGGFSSRSSLSFALMKSALVSGWNIATIVRRSIMGETYYRSVIEINGITIGDTYLSSFQGNVQTINNAIIASSVNTGALTAKALSPLALFLINNRFVDGAEQLQILARFKSDHGIA